MCVVFENPNRFILNNLAILEATVIGMRYFIYTTQLCGLDSLGTVN